LERRGRQLRSRQEVVDPAGLVASKENTRVYTGVFCPDWTLAKMEEAREEK
jgi:hypothetical protein